MGRIHERKTNLAISKASCDARPVHTSGSNSAVKRGRVKVRSARDCGSKAKVCPVPDRDLLEVVGRVPDHAAGSSSTDFPWCETLSRRYLRTQIFKSDLPSPMRDRRLIEDLALKRRYTTPDRRQALLR